MRALILAVAMAGLDPPDPPPPTPPPASACTVSLASPRDTDLLYGATTLVAVPACPDGRAPRTVTFQVDGREAGVATAAPWSVQFDAGTSLGPHVIRAVLQDDGGLQASATVATPGAQVRESVLVAAVPPDQVALSVSVSDRDGAPVRGLGIADFLVEEAGAPQTLLEARPDDRPLSLVVLIDVSSSLRPYWDVLREAAPAMARALRPQDKLRVVAFSGPACLVQDFTSDPQQVARAMRRFNQWGGGTSLYDTLAAVGTEMAWSRGGRQAVVLVTDGIDTLSRIDPPRLTEYLRRTTLVVEVLWVRRAQAPPRARRALQQLARETGGSVRGVRSLDEMQNAFRDLGARLQDRYYLSWRSDQAARGGWRSIDIEVRDRDAVALTRKGVINRQPIGEFLIADLRDAEPAGRAKAAEWLGRLPAEGAGEALLAALADRDARVKAAAAESLGILREPRGVEALLQLLATPVAGDREAARHGLRVYGPAAVPALLERLPRSGPNQQIDLIALLGDIGDARSLDAIVAFAQPSPPTNIPGRDAPDRSPAERRALVEPRLAAIEALGRMPVASTLPVLGRGAVDRDREVRRAALGALVEQATPAAFATLDRLARAPIDPPLAGAPAPDPGPPAEARTELIRGLGALAAGARLDEWLDDPAAADLYVRALASAAADRSGPWWPVVEAIGGAPAGIARLEALARRLPPEPAGQASQAAWRLREAR